MQTEEQQPNRTPIPPLDAEDYIENLQTLAQELDRAMGAIVARALPTFEDSLCRQRAVCARLTALPARSAQQQRHHPDLPLEPLDENLAARILAAATHLNVLNQRYSALLKHSGETMRLFAGLFRSYSERGQQSAGSPITYRTWSCEL